MPDTQIPQEEEQKAPVPVSMIDGIPYDLIQHFSLSPVDMIPETRRRLADIYRMLPGEGFSEKFRSLSKVERKIGSGGALDYRFQKVWNFLRLTRAMQDTGSPSAKARMDALVESTRTK